MQDLPAVGIDNVFLQTVLQGIGPAVGAWAACALFGIKMKMGLRGRFPNILIPLAIYGALPVLAIWTAADFIGKEISPLPVIAILIYGLLEEIGWRGFLQQMLRPLPRLAGIFLIALLWFAWHLNFELSASNLLFFGILLLGSWGIGLVAEKTRSLLAVAAFHALNNFFAELDAEKALILAAFLAIWIASVVWLTRSRKASPETAR